MTEQKIMMEEDNGNTNLTDILTVDSEAGSRKERRKAAKMEKRKKKRKELAEMARREVEARLNDPEEQRRLLAEEEQERLRAEEDRRRFEEMEKKILEAWDKKKALEEKEEDERKRRAEEEESLSKQNQVEHENGMDDDGWEYVEEGPPEIIWQGNEIIVKKKKVRVKKRDTDKQIMKEDPNRPTSNPLPPQSDAFADHKNASNLSVQQLLETVAQETPNFGTEQDKAHCPFHLKTGACRFGTRCSRIHFYPDKSCTLLIKNMYNGPGLAWEQDEGLEYTDEEVERAYEEFYEDVHTEFLKFGEIINFKVCRNGSSHLKGNVYVHYKSLDSAVQSYKSVNGRYFAGKQVQCEFVGVTRWKVAICGEFMKSKLKRCSRGTACNFIHCFRNPGGDYEWADWDKPAPRYWVKEMAALFGYPEESRHDRKTEQGSPGLHSHRYYSVQSQSRKIESSSSSRNYSDDDDLLSSEPWGHHRRFGRKHTKKLGHEQYLVTSNSTEKQPSESASNNHDTERYWSDKDQVRLSYSSNLSPSGRKRKLESGGGRADETNIHKTNPDENTHEYDLDTCHYKGSRRSRRHREKYDRCAGSKGEERIEDDKYTAKGPRQQKKTSTSPADKCNSRGTTTNDSDLTGDCSDGEGQNKPICREESPRSDGSEEFEDGNKRDCAHKLKNSSIWDHLDAKSPRDSHRRYKTSDYSSRYYNRKDRRRAERGTSDLETSGSDVRFDEVADERGRWEPDKEV